MDEKLDMTQQCALADQNSNSILGCIPSSVASRPKEGVLSPHLHCGKTPLALGPPAREGHGLVGVRPEEAMTMLRRLETNQEDFSLQKRKLQKKTLEPLQYLKKTQEKAGKGLLTRACSDITRGNGFKLK